MSATPEPPNRPSDRPKPAGLAHVLRATLSQAWDYIFLVMGGSLLWALSLGVPVGAAGLVAGMPFAPLVYYLLGALSVGPAWVGLYGLSAAMARRELPGMADFFGAFRRFYWRAAALFLVQVFVLGGCGLAAWFYQARFHHWALQAISLLWVYVGLFWVMMGLHVPAFLVRDDGSIWSALKRAALLTLAYPGYTFLVLLQIVFLLAVIVVPVLGRINLALGVSFILFFLFLPAFVSLLSTNALNDLLAHVPTSGHEENDGEQGTGNGQPEDAGCR